MNKKLFVLISLIVVLVSLLVIIVGCTPDDTDKKTGTSIENVSIYAQPQALYLVGDEFNLDKAKLKVSYANGTETYVDLEMGMISSYDKDVAGDYILQINYEGYTLPFKITVINPVVEDVTLSKSAEYKWSYVEGQEFDPRGLQVMVQYEGAQVRYYDVTREMAYDFIPTLIGTQTIHILYNHTNSTVYTLDLELTVKPKSLISIIVSSFPNKLTYFRGTITPDLSGGTLDLLYDNNYSERVSMATLPNLSYIWDTSVVTESANVKLLYADREANFNIRVILEDITQADIVVNPQKNQLVGTNLDLVGLSYRLTYTDNSIKNIVLNETNTYIEGETAGEPTAQHMVRIIGFDPQRVGVQDVVVAFYSTNGSLLAARFSLPITVIDKTIIDIEVFRTSEFDEDGKPLNEEVVYSRTPFKPYDSWTYVLHYDNGEQTEPALFTYNLINNVTNDSPLMYENAGNVLLQLNYSKDGYIVNDTYSFYVTQLEIEYSYGMFTQSSGSEEYGALPYLTISYGVDIAKILLTSIYALVEYNSGNLSYISLANSTIISDSLNTSNLQAETCLIQLNDNGILKVEEFAVKVMRHVSNFEIESAPLNTNYLVYNPDDTINDQSKYILNLAGLSLGVQYIDGKNAESVSDFSSGDWIFVCEDWLTEADYFKFTKVSNQKQIWIYNEGSPENRRYFTVTVTNNIKDISYAGGFKENTFNVIADDVYVGANIDLSAKDILVTYENNTTELVKITSSMVTYDYIKYTSPTESAPFTITYNGKPLYLYVNVIANEIKGITIVRQPYRTVFPVGGAFTDEGLIVAILHQNNTQTILAPDQYEKEGDSIGTAPNVVKTVTIKYRPDILSQEYTTSYSIYIVEVAVVSVSWVDGNVPIVENIEGKDLDLASYQNELGNKILRISDNTGRSDPVSFNSVLSEIEVIQYNRNSIVQETAILMLRGCTFTITVNIKRRTLNYILIDPLNITVVENAEIDLSILQLQITFDDGSKAAAPVLRENFYYSLDYNPGGYDYNNSKLGTNKYKVVYTYNDTTKDCDISITVVAKTLVDITLGVTPKNRYIEGEEFTTMTQDGSANGTLILTYDNGKKEILNLSDAKTSAIGANFYINNIKFNNEEFTGNPKLQTIYVVYVWNGIVFDTYYDIIMRDRRNPVIKYYGLENGSIFTYGDFKNEAGYYDSNTTPYATISYYPNYLQDNTKEIKPTDSFSGFDFSVEYVLTTEYFNSYLNDTSKGDKYKTLRSAGSYYIIVSYSGDANNNPITTTNLTSNIITINKLLVYVDIEEKSRVYGGDTKQIVAGVIPDDLKYTIYFYSAQNNASPEISPFAYDDSYNSTYFASQTNNGSECYYNSNLVKYITVTTTVEINPNTGVGVYFMTLSGMVSNNYQIVYNNSKRFTIEPRPLVITPKSLSIIYGTPNNDYTIEYETSSKKGFESTTGLTDYDILNTVNIGWSGGLDTTNAQGFPETNCGKHVIRLYTLKATNYSLQLPYDPNSNDDSKSYLTITQRDIYLQAANASSVFGSSLDTSSIKTTYFADSAMTLTNAFYYGDTPSQLGTISVRIFNGDTDITSQGLVPCGTYSIVPTITPPGDATIYNNYKITIIGGSLEITKKDIVIIIESLTKVFGESDAAISYKIKSGYELVVGMPLNGNYTPSRPVTNESENVGLHLINIDDMIANNPNYRLILESVAFYEITEKPLFIKFKDGSGNYYISNIISRVYDGKFPIISDDNYDIVDSEGLYTDKSDNSYALLKDMIDFELSNVTDYQYYAGDYNITIRPTVYNYTINFYYPGTNVYRITPKILDAEDFILTVNGAELPKNDEGVYSLPYNDGLAYTIVAMVKPESCVVLYDATGAMKVDNLGNPIRDSITVIPGSSSVSYSGDYSKVVTGVNNGNYQIQNTSNLTINYTITKKILTVQLKDATYNETLDRYVQYRVYDAAPIILYAETEYLIKDENQDEYSVANVRLHFKGYDEIYPSNVLYNDKTGEIIGYDLEILPFNTLVERDNYEVVFEKPNYAVVVTKRPITVTLYDQASNLTKAFNNTVPKIERSMMGLSDTTTNLDFSALKFTFQRSQDLYRTNSEVGVYSITLECDDPNHTVLLNSDYLYEIKKVDISIDVRTVLLSKVYNGGAFVATPDILSYKSTISGAIVPVVRTLYNADANSILTAQSVFKNAFDRATNIKNLASALPDGSDTTVATVALDNLASILNSFINYMNTLKPYLFNESVSIAQIEGYTSSLSTLITNALNAIGTANYTSTVTTLRINANALYAILDNINSYVLVSFDGGAINVGEYGVSFTTNDYNRNFTITVNSINPPKLKVTPSMISIKVSDGSSIYGVGTLDELKSNIQYSAELYSLPITIEELSKYIEIEFSLNTNEIWPYPASDSYQIIPSITIKDSNFAISPISVAIFKIERRSIYVHWNATESVTYGNSIKKSILTPVYLSEDSQNQQASTGLLEADKNLLITARTQNFNAYLKTDSTYVLVNNFFTAGIMPPAGTYLIRDSGSTFTVNSNYNVYVIYQEELPTNNYDQVVIDKAVLSVAISAGSIINRVYGDSLEMNYIGFVNGDTALKVLGSDFKLEVASDEGGVVGNLELGVGFDYPRVKFKNPTKVMDNYVFSDIEDIEFQINVLAAPLTIKLVTYNGSKEIFKSVYGETPVLDSDYTYDFVGWKNNDSNIQSAVVNGLNVNFFKSVASKEPLSSGRISLIQTNMSSDNRAILSNYSIEILTTEYVVEPRPVTITLSHSISALVTSKIEPHKINVQYKYTEEPRETGIRAYYKIGDVILVSGVYNEYDIKIEGLFGEDTLASVFKTLYTDFNPSLRPLADQDMWFEGYLASSDGSLLKCGVSYTSGLIGTQKATLKDVEFNLSTPNYQVVYEPFDLTLYSPLASIEMNQESLILEGDDETLEDLVFEFTYENQTKQIKQTYYTHENWYFRVTSGTIPTEVNKNTKIDVEYKSSANLSTLDPRFNNIVIVDTYIDTTVQEPTQYDCTIINSFPTTFSDSLTYSTAVTRYPRNTYVYTDGKLVTNNSDYIYGSLIDANSSTAMVYLTESTAQPDSIDANSLLKGNFDKYDTSIRLEPNQSTEYSFLMTIYTNNLLVDDGNTLIYSLVFKNGYVYLQITNGSQLLYTGAAIKPSVDIFDGFTHNIKVYVDKQSNSLQLILDNNYVLVNYSQHIVWDKQYLITTTDNCAALFSVTNAKLWVRHYLVANQGYSDKAGTIVMPSTSNKTFYLRSDSTGVENYLTINLQSLFKSSTALSPITFKYYVNDIEVTGNSLNSYSLNLGRYLVRQEVYNNSVLFDSSSIEVYVTYSGDMLLNGGTGYTQVYNAKPSPSSPVNLYGYTPNQTDDSIYDNTSLTRNVFEATHENGQLRYSKISVEFAVQQAVNNLGVVRGNAVESYILLATNATNVGLSTSETGQTQNFYSIGLALRYDTAGAISSRFHIMYNRAGTFSNYYSNLTCDWNSEKIYTVDLIFHQTTEILSQAAIELIIYEDGTKIVDLIVNQSYKFDYKNSTSKQTITREDIVWVSALTGNLDNTQTKRIAGFSMQDARLKVYRIVLGESSMGHDYLINNSYVQKPSKTLVIENDSTIHLSNYNDLPYTGRFTIMQLKFKASEKYDENGDFAFNMSGPANNSSITLSYRNGTLSYKYTLTYTTEDDTEVTFESPEFTISTGLTLFDNNLHTITVELRREDETTTSDIPNKMVPVIAGAIHYNKLYVVIDNNQYGYGAIADAIIFPYNQDLRHWYDKDLNKGLLNSSDAFLSPYLTPKLTIKGLTFELYNFDVSLKAL